MKASKAQIDELVAKGAVLGPAPSIEGVPPAGPDLPGRLAAVLRVFGYHTFEPEHVFHSDRLWRFDLAFPEERVAIECDGGLYVPGGGGHNRPRDYVEDLEKLNEATAIGWLVLRVTGRMIDDGRALAWIERALKLRRQKNDFRRR